MPASTTLTKSIEPSWVKCLAAVSLLVLLTAACDFASCQDAPGKSRRTYVVLNATQLLLFPVCKPTDKASLRDEATSANFDGFLTALHSPGREVQEFTLLTLGKDQSSKQLQFESSRRYTLFITSADEKPDKECGEGPISIDTKPEVRYVPNQAGEHGGSLTSNIAFSIPGTKGNEPINFVSADCSKKVEDAACVDIQIDWNGQLVNVGKRQFKQIDQADLQNGVIRNGNNIGRVNINSVEFLTLIQSTIPPGKDSAEKRKNTLLQLSNTLAGTSSAPLSLSAGPAAARKAPATKDLSWLWINGTVTAATGAAPAWVLDGKIDGPTWQFNNSGKYFSPILLKWANASTNIGNNKIGGQAAKDVIDFSAFTTSFLHEAGSVVSAYSIAPTYETNLALNHRNMLVAGDAVFNIKPLERSQAVRMAQYYFANRDKRPDLKLPEQGSFPKDYPTTGWTLTPHLGFEAGGAIATTTITNPKTNAVIGVLPTYSIARFVPQIDGLYQYRNFSLESYITGRYLFTTEHTAVNNKAGIPYLETVSGWKAVNVLTFNYTPGASPHVKFNVAYTDGFSAPTYQRANGVKIGVAVAY